MKVEIEKILRIGLWMVAVILATVLISGPFNNVYASDRADAQALIDQSKGTITSLLNDDKFSWMREFIKDADAVLIFPQVIKAGFFLGGSGGTGVLLVRNRGTHTWSEPAFYTVGSVTFGLQIGGEAAEVVMLAMNRKAVDSLLSSTVKLGGDASVTIGPVGAGAKGAVTIPAVTADFVSFSSSAGLYAGLDLEGSVLAVRDSLNSAYYNRPVSPKDIIIKRNVSNPGANGLRAVLQRAVSR
jgi:lipid-binding SYLF domain-containing protein